MEGMTGESLETLRGELTLKLWRGDELLLEAHSNQAALEVRTRAVPSPNSNPNPKRNPSPDPNPNPNLIRARTRTRTQT